MQLTAGISIQSGDQVTRQTLYDILGNATGGNVAADDLEAGVLPVLSGTGETQPVSPGTVLYEHAEQLWKVFVDVIDGTGCSVWLAWGPDRMDDALLAMEPIPPGAAVQIPLNEGNNRQVKLADGDDVSSFRVMVINTSRTTTPSGTWFAGAVTGLVRAWVAYKPAASTSNAAAGVAPNAAVQCVPWARGALGGSSGSGDASKRVHIGWGTVLTQPHTGLSGGNWLTRILFHGPRFYR